MDLILIIQLEFTRKVGISELMTHIQRDVDIHLGTSLFAFGIGVNVKQYWFNSKYKAVSFFSSASSSFSVILGWGKDESLGLDVHTIASGVDINIIRFNRFDIGLSAGIFAGGSFIQMQGGACTFSLFFTKNRQLK